MAERNSGQVEAPFEPTADLEETLRQMGRTLPEMVRQDLERLIKAILADLADRLWEEECACVAAKALHSDG